MKVYGIDWLREILDKITQKHGVTKEEVEEVFENRPQIYFVEKGKFKGEDVYSALGQTDAGRYLIVFFIHKITNRALILSARDMNKKERKRYGKK